MSLRVRLILSHTLIVVLCLCIVAVAVAALLQGYRTKFAVARLDDMTVPLYIQARSLAQGEASLDEVWDNLAVQAVENGVYILLIDSEGTIVRQASPGDGLGERPLRLPSGWMPDDLSEPYHGTYVASGGQSFVYAAYPLAGLFGPEKANVPEALVLAVPRSGALALWAGLARPFLWAGLIALAASVLVAIWLARSLYRPLHRVTRAAERMAQGDYGQEIAAEGPQEVRGLALAFNHMAQQVQQSQQRLRQFVADVSHELRSPLTSISGFAQAILDGTARDQAAQARAVGIIDDESRRMRRLVDELLELSRIESGQVQIAQGTVDVSELLAHCAELFQLRAEDRGVALELDLGAVPAVTGDIDRLEQVFANLIDNALKHTPAGGQVRIASREAGGHVEVAIADSGPGIPFEERPHIFERFYRSDASPGDGTGLGLAIARELARAHGGDIEVRSPAGQGAELVVTLPLGPSPE